jgi:hypothetical protein
MYGPPTGSTRSGLARNKGTSSSDFFEETKEHV